MTPEEMAVLLRDLVEIESPTGDDDGIRRAGELVAARLGVDVRCHEGGHLEAELDGEGEPLLVLGHLDTVWPRGTLEAMPWRVEGGLAFGPGAYDMKAGVVAVLAALEQARPGRRPVRLFFGADEETGSVVSRPLIERAAAGVAAALVVEPCLPGGGVKTARKGLGKFRIGVRGIAAHAGTSPQEGASAIDELARQVLRLHGLTDERRGITVNVGLMKGGTARNVVAAEAAALVDVRIVHPEDAERVEAAIRALRPELDGTRVRIEGGWTRPPLEPDESTARLVERARAHARELGLGDLREGRSGGGSDGNLVGALDVPVLDGLGPDGGGAHAEDEHVLLASIPQRAALIARLLEDPGV